MDSALFLVSNTLSKVALRAAQRSAKDADDNLVAILFSAAYFEGTLNEVLQRIIDGDHSNLPANYDKIRLAAAAAGLGDRFANIERKVRVLAAASAGCAVDTDKTPWKELFLLFRLRNWMVHLRPERMNVRTGRPDEPSSLVSTSVHALVNDLLEVGAISSVPEGRMVPVMLATRLNGVGPWAYKAAYGALEELAMWLPELNRLILTTHTHPSAARAAV